MKYSNIISKLFNEPALITPVRHAALCLMLENRLASAAMQNAEVRTKKSAEKVDGGADPMEPMEPDDSGDMETKGRAAIINVHGTIVRYPEDIAMSECGCDLDTLNASIDAAENDPRIDRVIFDFRTPGGSVTGVPETGRKIQAMRKDTIAFTASECCSGGIWLAAQCKRFYATQSSRVGSVGVYTMALDMSKAMQKDGIKVNAISAGKYKLMGAYWKEMTAEERGIMQGNVDRIYDQFRAAMSTHRVIDDENYGNGLVFDGEQAFERGFLDGVVEDISEVIEGFVE